MNDYVQAAIDTDKYLDLSKLEQQKVVNRQKEITKLIQKNSKYEEIIKDLRLELQKAKSNLNDWRNSWMMRTDDPQTPPLPNDFDDFDDIDDDNPDSDEGTINNVRDDDWYNTLIGCGKHLDKPINKEDIIPTAIPITATPNHTPNTDKDHNDEIDNDGDDGWAERNDRSNSITLIGNEMSISNTINDTNNVADGDNTADGDDNPGSNTSLNDVDMINGAQAFPMRSVNQGYDPVGKSPPIMQQLNVVDDNDNDNISSINCLIDTGSNINAINTSYASSTYMSRIVTLKRSFPVYTASGSTKVNKYIRFNIKQKNKHIIPIRFYLMDIPFNFILGRGGIRLLKITISALNDEEYVHKANDDHTILQSNDIDDNYWDDQTLLPPKPNDDTEESVVAIHYIRPLDMDKWRSHDYILNTCADVHKPERSGKRRSQYTKQSILALLPKMNIQDPIIRKNVGNLIYGNIENIALDWADCGTIPGVELEIELKDNFEPFNIPLYSSNWKYKAEIDRQERLLANADFIERSKSRIGSSITMAKKKHGELRLCVDYRRLNKYTVVDQYPIPNMHERLAKIGSRITVYSAIDIRHGYYHINIKESDRWKTAFYTFNGLWQFKKTPFGLINAPKVFQRAMDKIFHDLDFVLVYIDDILVMSENEKQHLEHLRIIFERLRKYKLKIRPDKCYFFQPSLKYLGYLIDSYGARADPDYINKVIELKKPKNPKELERFLGMIGWIGKFIPQLSHHTSVLTPLRRKKSKWLWTNDQDIAFNNIKNLAERTPILKHPDLDKEFIVITDASDYALGGVLMQKNANDDLVPVEYMSKQFDVHQRNWHCSEKEIYAVIVACEKWRKFLLRRRFTIYTDHRNLITLLEDPRENSKLNRWTIRLQPYDFVAKFIAGIDNIVADYLSRDIIHTKGYKDFSKNQSQGYTAEETFFVDRNVIKNPNDNSILTLNLLNDKPYCITNAKKKKINLIPLKHDVNNYGSSNNNVRRSRRLINKKTNYNDDNIRIINTDYIPPNLNSDDNDINNESNDDNVAHSTHDKSEDEVFISKKNREKGKQQKISKNDELDIFGSHNNLMDQLYSPVNNKNIFDTTFLMNHQKADPELNVIIKALDKKTGLLSTIRDIDNNNLKEGLYRINNHKLLVYGDDMRIVIPPTLRSSYLHHFHNHITKQHNGKQRMYKDMSKEVWWRGLRRDISDYCQVCPACQMVKGNRGKHTHLSLFPCTYPFQIIAIDLVGPLPTTSSDNTYILSAIDRYSRMCRIIPIPDIKTCTITRYLLDNWIYVYGAPEQILSDRGSQFLAQIFKHLCNIWGIKKIYTSAYHPETDGMIERLHRWIKERLRIMSVEKNLDFINHDDWDIFCGCIQFAYNTQPNKMTGYAPYTIIYGKDINLPDTIQKINSLRDDKRKGLINKNINLFDRDPILSKKDKKRWLKHIQIEREIINDDVFKQQEKYDNQRRRYFAKKHQKGKSSQHRQEDDPNDNVIRDLDDKKDNKKKKKPNNSNSSNKVLRIGDKVLHYIGDRYVGNKSKLIPQYDDRIWRITKCKNNGNSFFIRDGSNIRKWVHKSKLKRYFEFNDLPGKRGNNNNNIHRKEMNKGRKRSL